MEIDTLIARRLREHRTAHGWSLDDLAQRSGISRAMISRIEREDSSPTAGLLARLCDALGITLSQLMTETDAPRATVSRRDEQMQWRDPASGYVRRMVSPPGGEDETEIVAVDLPPGARVAFPPHTPGRYEQQVLVLQGSVRLTLGRQQEDLGPGDCARMAIDEDHGFENPGDRTAHYLVVIRRKPGGPR
jgi:transcriptional regulator with XRE-family HTH domain